MSSLLVHFTVVPAATKIVGGEKLKLSILTAVAAGPWASATPKAPKPKAPKPTTAAAAQATRRRRSIFFEFLWFNHLGEGLIDHRQALAACDEADFAHAEHAAQFVGRRRHWARRGAGGSRRRLREGGGAGGVEGNVSFQLLLHLVDVAVQH